MSMQEIISRISGIITRNVPNGNVDDILCQNEDKLYILQNLARVFEPHSLPEVEQVIANYRRATASSGGDSDVQPTAAVAEADPAKVKIETNR